MKLGIIELHHKDLHGSDEDNLQISRLILWSIMHLVIQAECLYLRS